MDHPGTRHSGQGVQVEEVTRYFRVHKSEHEQSREAAGITMERVYTMESPKGLIVAAYQEGRNDFAKTNEILARSTLPIDLWFFDAVKEIHGIDLRQPAPGPAPEVLFDWVDPQAKDRQHGLAFASPVAASKTEKGRTFVAEAFGKRVNELTASRRKLGGTHEFGTLHHTPMGDILGVYLEGDDPRAANAAFARSTDDYDVWFKSEVGDVLGQDFNKPPPTIREVFDYQRQSVASTIGP